jgi:transcriptional regulator with XRE-family HTH domain
MSGKWETSPPEDVTARLVILRLWLGLSESEMAARLRMTPATYRQWEHRGGRRWRSLKPIMKVADAINVSAAWLAYGPRASWVGVQGWPAGVDVLGDLAQHVCDLDGMVSTFEQGCELAQPGSDAAEVEAQIKLGGHVQSPK